MPIPASGRPGVAVAMKVVRASSAASGVVVDHRPSASAWPRASTIRARILEPPVSTPANTLLFISGLECRADQAPRRAGAAHAQCLPAPDACASSNRNGRADLPPHHKTTAYDSVHQKVRHNLAVIAHENPLDGAPEN